MPSHFYRWVTPTCYNFHRIFTTSTYVENRGSAPPCVCRLSTPECVSHALIRMNTARRQADATIGLCLCSNALLSCFAIVLANKSSDCNNKSAFHLIQKCVATSDFWFCFSWLLQSSLFEFSLGAKVKLEEWKIQFLKIVHSTICCAGNRKRW